jgi:hypothetical protein
MKIGGYAVLLFQITQKLKRITAFEITDITSIFHIHFERILLRQKFKGLTSDSLNLEKLFILRIRFYSFTSLFTCFYSSRAL